MTLNQLEYFCAVCRYRSITRAAEELFVSQPTISVALRGLENEFGIRFFIHGKNRIALTLDGERFYHKAQSMLDSSQRLYDEFASLGQRILPVRVGIPPMIGTIFFPGLLRDFRRAHADVPVQLVEYGSVRAARMVMAEELDVALVNMDFYDSVKMNSFEIMTDSIVYVVSSGHPLAGEKEVSIGALREELVIFLNTDSVMNRTVGARFGSLGTTPHVLMYSSQLTTTLSFVRGGRCGAFLFSSLPVGEGEFVKLPVVPAITSRFGLVWKTGPVQQRAQMFIDFVRGKYASQGE